MGSAYRARGATAVFGEGGRKMNEVKATEEGLEHLLRLEEKIFRTMDLVRKEKEELLRENALMRRRLADQDKMHRTLQERVVRLEKERDGVKTRVQKLLEQVDSLTQALPEA